MIERFEMVMIFLMGMVVMLLLGLFGTLFKTIIIEWIDERIIELIDVHNKLKDKKTKELIK